MLYTWQSCFTMAEMNNTIFFKIFNSDSDSIAKSDLDEHQSSLDVYDTDTETDISVDTEDKNSTVSSHIA